MGRDQRENPHIRKLVHIAHLKNVNYLLRKVDKVNMKEGRKRWQTHSCVPHILLEKEFSLVAKNVFS